MPKAVFRTSAELANGQVSNQSPVPEPATRSVLIYRPHGRSHGTSVYTLPTYAVRVPVTISPSSIQRVHSTPLYLTIRDHTPQQAESRVTVVAACLAAHHSPSHSQETRQNTSAQQPSPIFVRLGPAQAETYGHKTAQGGTFLRSPRFWPLGRRAVRAPLARRRRREGAAILSVPWRAVAGCG